MKKLTVIFSIIALALTTQSFANSTSVEAYRSVQVTRTQAFNKIVVEDDIDLVIYENKTENMQFDGNKTDIAKVEWKIRNGVLYIRSKQGSLRNKVLVTLDVTNLTKIEIVGNSNVRSLGALNSPLLQVYISGESHLSIRNQGGIDVINATGGEMDVQEQIGDIVIR